MADNLDRVDYAFTCDEGPEGEFNVHRMRLVEAIDTTFELNLEIVTTELDADVDKFLGAACRLDIMRADRVRPVFGIVDRVEFIGHNSEQLIVGLRIVPAFALTGHVVNSRIFQEMSVQDIIKKVLDEALGPYARTFDPGGTARGTDPRDYCLQYRESDRDFVERLLEEEGISYHFVHDDGVGHEVLTFTYENDDFQDIANTDGSALVPIIRSGADDTDVESLTGLDYARTLTSTATMHMDFDWKSPSAPLFSPAEGEDERGRVRRVYRHDQRRFITDDSPKRAPEHQAALALPGKIGRGTSNCITFVPTGVFELERHQRADLEQRWVITRVEHRGAAPEVLHTSGRGAEIDSGRYLNTIACVPQSVTVRPTRRIPKPRAWGPETATVVGPSGEEIHTDEHGRIKVQFHWEENPKKDDTSSCWIRVRQNWAGAGWGFQFIPRIGMEVVVEFLSGNPDRPLVNGCVYNGDNPPTYDVPGDKTKSGIKTNSVAGSGFNELRFEDSSGSEELWMHAQKDMNTVVLNNQTLDVGKDRTITIGQHLSDTIKVNKTIEVGGNHTESISGNMGLTVSKNQTISVTQDVTETISGKRVQSISKTSKVSVILASDEFVGAKKSVKVVGLYSEQVGASRSITAVGAMTFTAGLSGKFQCARNVMVKARKDLTLEGDDNVAMKSGKKTAIQSGDDMAIDAKKKFSINVADEFSIKCGDAELKMKKDGTIELIGKDITIKGSGKIAVKADGDVILKGSKVAQN
jgi:type VI secretion system secreted protein VgrG